MKYHYVYRISNILINKHYYGVRTSIKLPIDDLGKYYFSSSTDKDFIKDQKDNPQNYKYKIIKTTKSRYLAIESEIKLHNKFDVGINEYFYNKAKQSSSKFDTTGTKLTEEHKNKCSNSLKGRVFSQDHRKKIGLAHKGRKKSESSKEKQSISMKGRKTGRTIPKEQHNKMHNAQKKIFKVYNNLGKLMFECIGNFERLCKDNRLPFGALKRSYQNKGTTIYKRKEDQTIALREDRGTYIGWYCLKVFKGDII